MRILSRRQVLELLSLHDCIAAVEDAFRRHAEGRTLGPGVLGVPAAGGGFHIKAAGLLGPRSYFAAKTNANFPENPRRFGLPTIRGTVMLADAETGGPVQEHMVERLASLPRGRYGHMQVVANAILADVFVENPRAESSVELRVFLDMDGRDDAFGHRISSRSAAFSACSNVGLDMVCRVASMAFSA